MSYTKSQLSERCYLGYEHLGGFIFQLSPEAHAIEFGDMAASLAGRRTAARYTLNSFRETPRSGTRRRIRISGVIRNILGDMESGN